MMKKHLTAFYKEQGPVLTEDDYCSLVNLTQTKTSRVTGALHVTIYLISSNNTFFK